jgi:hypothetical protein
VRRDGPPNNSVVTTGTIGGYASPTVSVVDVDDKLEFHVRYGL